MVRFFDLGKGKSVLIRYYKVGAYVVRFKMYNNCKFLFILVDSFLKNVLRKFIICNCVIIEIK